MFDFSFKLSPQSKKTMRKVRKLPSVNEKAEMSALRRTGNWLRDEIKDYIKQGGSGWPPLKDDSGDKPLAALRHTVGVRLTRRKGLVSVKVAPGPPKYARSFKAKHGTSLLVAWRGHEKGRRIRVSEKMRGRFLAKGQPMRKSTRYIQIPARPVWGPVWEKYHGRVKGKLERFYFDKLKRELGSRVVKRL